MIRSNPEELIRKSMAAFVDNELAPQAKEIEEKAKELEPEVVKRWSAKGVATHLKRYGMKTNKTVGRHVYGRVTLADLLVVQQNYSLDLGLSDESDGA